MYLRKRILLVIAAALLTAASPFWVAAAPGPVQTPTTPAASTATMMEMPIVAPLFVVDERFSSTLVLVNGGAVETYADVTVRGLDGSTLATRRVNFAAHSQRQIDIGQLLRAANASATTGSITVMQSPDLVGPAIAAQLSLTYMTYPEANYIDEELAMPSADGSQVLRAVSDESDGSPLVAVTSLSESVQHIQIDCLSKNGPNISPNISKIVELAAGETLLTEACSAETMHGADLQTVRRRANADGPKRSFGLALTSDAMPGAFAAFGLGLHKAKGSEFFSSIPFSDPKMWMSPNTIFAGVPVGFATPLSPDEYVPKLSLANFSKHDVRVRVKYARTSGANPVVQDLQSIVVHSQSSRTIALNHLRGDPELRNSFVILPDGASPGDVLAKLSAEGDSRLLKVELLGKDEKAPENGGNHPWFLKDGDESTLLLFNHGRVPRTFNILLSANGIVWRKAYRLRSMQTTALSIRALIEGQVKDDFKTALPLSATSGQIGWVTAEFGTAKGRILRSNTNSSLARNFSCGDAVEPCAAAVDPTSVTLAMGRTANATLNAQFCHVQFSCTGTLIGNNLSGFPITWETVNPSIASPTSGSYTTTITPLSLGATNANGTVSNPTPIPGSSITCSVSSSTGVTVQTTFIDTIDPQIAMIGSNSVQITINGTGFGTSPTVNLPAGFTQTGVASTDARIVVTANIGFSATIGNNPVSVTANGQTSNSRVFTVNGPNKMVVQNNGDVIGQTTNNPTAFSRFVTYQVQNVDNTAAVSIPIAENISFTGYNCAQPDPGHNYAHCDGTYRTNANGILTDEWGMYTNYSPAGCGVNVTDHWQWCGPAGSNPPAPNPGKTFGTLSGWVHTSNSRINSYTNPPSPMPGGLVINP